MTYKFRILLPIAVILLLANFLLILIPQQDPVDPAVISRQSELVLGDSTSTSNKRIEVDLTGQRLYAYENDQLVFDYLISSGTWNRTPTGVFKIWAKIRSQKMSGGSKELGTYYYLPNVPFILFFYNEKTPKKVGYSIHGAYWHNNFGVPMSHGCVNMKIPEAEAIYNFADSDTPIIIYGKYVSSRT